MTINNKRHLAHRVSYAVFHGTIPDGAYICHHCDVTDCVNPDHIYAGNAKTNRADCIKRGRDNTAMLVRCGSQRSDSKLTEIAVIEIRKNRESARFLAKRYGVSHRTIYKVRSRHSWTHV